MSTVRKKMKSYSKLFKILKLWLFLIISEHRKNKEVKAWKSTGHSLREKGRFTDRFKTKSRRKQSHSEVIASTVLMFLGENNKLIKL